MANLFMVQVQAGETSIFPWTGSAIARFEPSTLNKYADHRVLHLRILKIVKPVAATVNLNTYRGRVLRPEEGQLFMKLSRYDRVAQPWAYDIDKSSQPAPGLRVLWDNARKR
ncbi:hypothetical protein FB451DRAFT_1282255 [Mycena latifolia]|nr:hypothetical protein FB451DRAFT_1282255 [Mycena latifolia]